MNLVELVKNQLSGEITRKLGAVAGSNEVQTKTAMAAAVPTLLAALSGTAAKGGSADKLAGLLGRFDSGSLGSLAGTLSTEPNQAVEHGNQLLGSLFGENTLTSLITTISRFVGLDTGSANKLISGLAPVVMGAIAGQFKGKPLTGAALTSLFAEQKANIANALPAGLSLAGIPGMPQIGDTVRNVADASQQTARAAASGSSSLLKTVVPVALVALVALLAWQYFSGRTAEVEGPSTALPRTAVPDTAVAKTVASDTATSNTVASNSAASNTVAQTEMPHEVKKPVLPSTESLADVTQFSKGLTSAYANATATLGQIKDVNSAKEALPKLEQLRTSLNGLKANWDKIPPAARATISAGSENNIAKLQKLIAPLMTNPQIKAVLQPILDQIVAKLQTFNS